ncbi:GNAT family N-acetyltransferase [Kitasatospora sp. NBC_01287]|uniref:GNAT family N-acetyltransferase n=1 Tax=Kitasatospora sp. NBC_01287 TaxID=2903573 RepID=UPI00225603B7|nr:GNAT family N-acetyltransferase [Kitasatospora sp. NBC_01287]MCX4744376.1 GNAT family N-acetyltransferase [Kitasatospora sp. NBC_01287]
MTFQQFAPVQLDDIDGLLALYREVYGSGYALPIGTDPAVMAREIAAPDTTWLAAREPGGGRIVGTIIGTLDARERLGKLQGLVVHPDARGTGLAHQAVRQLSEALLGGDRAADSVYATARTNSTAPQRVCLSAGFRALGIFPNLRKAEQHETMVLLAKHRPGVLEGRLPVDRVPAGLADLVLALHEAVGLPGQPLPVVDHEPLPARRAAADGAELELIGAPRFVLRRIAETLPDPEQRFYPFHTPDTMLTSADGGYEVYAQLNPSDGYCALIGATPSEQGRQSEPGELSGLSGPSEPSGLSGLSEVFETVIAKLAEHGASHLEALLPLDSYQDLRLLLAHGFLPAAAYPAMRRQGEGWRDYVVMARSLQPLDFRGLSIDAAFQPFTEQYIEQWKQQYLNTHGVFQ